MAYHAAQADPSTTSLPVFTYGMNWDANMIYGCECDVGFSGYDCSLRT